MGPDLARRAAAPLRRRRAARRARARQPAHRRPLGAARRPRRRARPRGAAAPGAGPGAADGRGAADHRGRRHRARPHRPGCRAGGQRSGAGRGHPRRGRCGAPRAGRPARLPGVGGRHPQRRLGRARPRLVVHLGHAAPARARAVRGPRGDPRPAPAGAQPRPRHGGDRRLQCRAPPRDVRDRSPLTCASTPCSPTRPSSTTSRPWPQQCARLGATLLVTPVGRRDRPGSTTRCASRPPCGTLWPPRDRPDDAWQDDRHGDDGEGEGRAEQARGDQAVLPQVRGRRDAEVRRGAAHHRGAHRRRGRAGHGERRPPPATRALRGLRPHPRGPRARGRWAAQGQPVRGAGGPGRRVARPADRPDRQPRAPGARAPAQGRERLGVRRRGRVARGVPRPRLAHRAGPLLGPRGHLPRARGGPRAGRRGPTDGHLGQGP